MTQENQSSRQEDNKDLKKKIEKLEKDNKELYKIYNNARDELDDETKKAEFDKNIQKLKDIEKELNIQELKQDIHNENRMKELEKDE